MTGAGPSSLSLSSLGTSPQKLADERKLAAADEALVRWYECGRKQAFPTWAEAEEHAQLIMRETPVQNGHNLVIAAYECQHCGLSHVGKQRFKVGPVPWDRRVAQARKQWAHEESLTYTVNPEAVTP